MKLRVLPPFALVACLGLAVTATPAQAAEPETHIQVTSPTSQFMVDDEVTGEDAITLTGTSTLTAGQKVDINCYSGATWSKLAENVEVNAVGSFAFGGFLHAIADETCVLRAVPVADAAIDYPPNGPTRFTGPLLAIGQRYDRTIVSGPNAGKLTSQYLYDSQMAGGFDYGSLGDCSIIDSYLYDPFNFANSPLNRLDACNAFLWWENGKKATGSAAPTRSDLQVDGANAYLPANIPSLFKGAESLPGFPTLNDKYTVEPGTGNLVLEEGEPVVKCTPGTAFPPSAENCLAFVPTGVQAYLRVTQGSSGRLSSVTQYFEAADGQTHQIDLLDDNEFFTPRENGLFDFPWLGAGFQPYTSAGAVLAPPPGGPATFYARASAEGVLGSVTLSSAPEAETIVGTTNSAETSRVNLHYRRTIPAGEYVALGFTFTSGFALGEVEANASVAQGAYLPQVAISSPATGSSTSKSSVTVSGTAGDASGLASLIVAGQRVTPGANGAWSASVPLAPGQNTITATATNIFGNSSQAQVAVSYQPPSGPTSLKLVGKAHLAAAGVAVTVRCVAPAGQRCTGVGTLWSQERRRGGHLVGVAASGKAHSRGRRNGQTVVGSQGFSTAAGKTVRVIVGLNPRGRRLLSRFGALPVKLVVQSTGAGPSRGHTLAGGTLRLRALRTGRIALSIRQVIRRARHIDTRVSCPSVVVVVRGGTFTCVATGSTGHGSKRKPFRTPFTVIETDTRGDVRYHS